MFKKTSIGNLLTANLTLNMLTIIHVLWSLHFVKSKGGAWMVNVSKPPNYDSLSSAQKATTRTTSMIDNK